MLLGGWRSAVSLQYGMDSPLKAKISTEHVVLQCSGSTYSYKQNISALPLQGISVVCCAKGLQNTGIFRHSQPVQKRSSVRRKVQPMNWHFYGTPMKRGISLNAAAPACWFIRSIVTAPAPLRQSACAGSVCCRDEFGKRRSPWRKLASGDYSGE